MKGKVILGTANFGLKYGIANKKKLDRDEIFKILELARAEGIWGIDTAGVYGDAEEIIGEFFARRGKVFRVIGKLPRREYLDSRAVEDEIYGALKRMNISLIDSLLIHSFETYKLYGKIIIPALQTLCRDGVIGRYGVSVYHPEEAEHVVRETHDNLAIEFPLNLFDQRFLSDNFMQTFKTRGHLLFARSVFLQGLFFLDNRGLEGNFRKVGKQLRRIRDISESHSMRPECLALLFAISKSQVDGVVIGVDSAEQFLSNRECFSDVSCGKFKQVESLLPDLAVYDEDIILPYRWKA
ncbi:MAG: aldo/keto reductase [Nitrospirae bacterium]|nr:aldo/keto reductase [Nitrospirota bacterium]MCL5237996.1 aldo/keto reductase [Nitrospirota bacterium]